MLRTGKPASPRTVHDNDLAALKSVFGWAVDNHILPANPATAVKVKGAAKAKSRSQEGNKDFTPKETGAILSACLRQEQRQSEAVQSYALRRWVPWVLAYTGARVGEIVQLRKQDVRWKGDHWVIHITPDAGTVKTDLSRDVPIHPHLVELGFVSFATAAPDERLFLLPQADGRRKREAPSKVTSRGKRRLTPPAKALPTHDISEGGVEGRVKAGANRLREFIHEVLPNLTKQPNHAWRHLMETRCREVGIEDYYQRMFTCHALRDDHERYGEPAGLYREMRRLPRFEID